MLVIVEGTAGKAQQACKARWCQDPCACCLPAAARFPKVTPKTNLSVEDLGHDMLLVRAGHSLVHL